MTHTKNPKNGNSHTTEEHCSFCGKHHSEVLMLFQGGSGARICNECIEQGYHTLVEHHVVADPLSATPPMQQTPLHYEELLKPAQIKEMLDQYVIGQEAAKRYLSVAVYNTTNAFSRNRPTPKARSRSTNRTSCSSARRERARRSWHARSRGC